MANPRIVVDTSVLIEYFRKTNKERTVLYRYAGIAELFISTMTEFEFWIGANPLNENLIRNIVATMTVLPVDSACVQIALGVHCQLKPINRRLPIQDTFIAATAITHNVPLLTLNQKHFAPIQNLLILSE